MYDFKIDGYCKIKHEKKEYPWPCKSEPERLITIYGDDILTSSDGKTYMKHTGLGCFGIEIPKEDVIFCNDVARLRLM
jgi:hypothetical protein